jgi:hypothetical protein
MTQKDPDRVLKRIWLVIGVLVLPLVVSVLFIAGRELSAGWFGYDRRTAVAAPTDPTAPLAEGPRRAVRFDLPVTIRGTATRIAMVRHGAGFEPELSRSRVQALEIPASASVESAVSYSSDPDGPIVNVAVLASGGRPDRLIFDRAVYIHQVNYPGERYATTDSLQTWITYEVSERDTDGNEKLDREDNRTLYVTDLDGGNLRRVLPDGWLLRQYRTQPDRRSIVISAIQVPSPTVKNWNIENAPQRAFIFDVATGQVQSYAALDSLAARAALLLAAPRAR